MSFSLSPTRFLSVLALAALVLAAPAFTQAQTDSRPFPQTGQTVAGRFLAYWDQHGGLAQQGYPISPELSEQSALDGKTYTVQYFERAVFEYHPENNGTPFEVLLSQLGTFQYRQRYGTAGCRSRATPSPRSSPR
jgi:hypothetical protein